MDHTTFTETLGDEKQINLWNTALIKSKAVIAGGGVLAPYAGYVRKDLDIYVGKENLVTLCNNLLPLGLKTSYHRDGISTIRVGSKDQICFSSGYDKSFFRKNHLLARLGVRVNKHIQVGTILEMYDPRAPRAINCAQFDNFRSTYRVSKISESAVDDEEYPDEPPDYKVTLKGVTRKYFRSEFTPADVIVPMQEILSQEVDIIVVDTEKTTVEDVVSNFDLSFCEIWYDGTGIKLGKTDPEEILQKKGFLQGEYVQSLIDGNVFIKDRLAKYKGRGFSIELKHDKDILYDECRSMTKVTEENLDLWASYFTYTYLLISTSILIYLGTPSIYPVLNYQVELLPLLQLISASASPGSYTNVKLKTVSMCLAMLIAQPRWNKSKGGDCNNEGGCIVELIRRYAPEAMKPLSEDMSRKDQISAIAKILQDKYSHDGDGYDFLSFYQLRCFGIYLQTVFGTSPIDSQDWNPQIYYAMSQNLRTTPSRKYLNKEAGVWQGVVDLPTWIDILWGDPNPMDPPDFAWEYMKVRPSTFTVENALDLLSRTPRDITSRSISKVLLWEIKGDIWNLQASRALFVVLEQYRSETELNTKDGPPLIADLMAVEESEEKQEESDLTKQIMELSAQLLIAQRAMNISEVRRLMKERRAVQEKIKPVVDSEPKGLTIDRYNDQPILEGDNLQFGFFTFITIGPGGKYQAWGSSIGTLFDILTPNDYKGIPRGGRRSAMVGRHVRHRRIWRGGTERQDKNRYQEFKARITRPQEFEQKDNQAKCMELLEALTNNAIPNLDKVLVKCGGNANTSFPSYDQMVDGYNAIWYAKIDTGPTYRSAIPYNSLKAIIKSYIGGYRVFMLSGETNLQEVSTVGNLRIGPGAFDLSNSDINTVSGTHCNNIGHVYNNVTIFMQPNNEPPSFHPLGSNIVRSEDTVLEESKEEDTTSEEKSVDRNVTIGRARGRARAARLRSSSEEEEDVSARMARLRADLDAAAEEEESLDRNVTTGGARGRARAERLRSAAEEGDVVDEYRSGGESLAEGASIDEENGLDSSDYDNEEDLMNAVYFGAGAGGAGGANYGGYIPPHLRPAPSDSDSESMYGGYIPPRVPSIDYEEEDHN